jgi:pyrroloquinoline-quinone synthase
VTEASFEARLQRTLDERYHDRHPFNLRMHAGELTAAEIRIWVRNRYYYQTRIPIKDEAIVAKTEDPAFKKEWGRRIQDHRGEAAREGGLELWLQLAEAVGLGRGEVASLRDVLPGARRACDAYVEFVGSHDLLESVAASLTELRAGSLMGRRIADWAEHYPWVKPEGLAYFRSRTEQAPRDAEEGLAFVIANARGAADQERCVAALERKCEILWSFLDAVEWGSARPRLAAGARLRQDREGPLVVAAERAVKLNASGREILECCDGTRTTCEVATALREAHPDVEELEGEVYSFLEEMAAVHVVGFAR